MRIEFMVDNVPAVFERSTATGRAVLRAGDETVRLQSSWNPLTHLDLSTTKRWTTRIPGRQISITKKRARMWGGLRPAHFVVFVDEVEVASATGY